MRLKKIAACSKFDFSSILCFSTLCFLLICLVQANPCPKETQMYGGATLDGSADEYEEYFVVDDDDQTRITTFRYCVCCINRSGVHEHFRGFEATIFSPTSGYSTQVFGTMDGTDPDTFCGSHDMSMEELMYLTIYADSNDAEGIVWEGNFGTKWVSRANGNVSSPKLQMGGRPIGFRVWMGKGGMDNQPLKISVVFNSCNCPASTFSGANPFLDMEIMAVVGPTQIQELKYQENYIESVYGQDCGQYIIESFPSFSFFNFSTSGTRKNPQGKFYTDTGTFTSGTHDDVGQYTVLLVTKQVLSDPTHGYNSPVRGIIPQSEQNFTLTIQPCEVNTLAPSPPMKDLTYYIPGPDLAQGTFGFAEQPYLCGYNVTTEVTNLPSWAVFDEAARKFTVPQTFDQTKIGAYPVTITARTERWTDWTKSSKMQIVGTQVFTIFIEPCLVNSIDIAQPVSDVFYTIGTPGGAVSGVYSIRLNPAVCDYLLSISVSGLMPLFDHNELAMNFVVPYTEDKSLVGTYPVKVAALVTHFADHTMTSNTTIQNSFDFNIHLLDPCLTTKLMPLTVANMQQSVMSPGIWQELVYPQDSVSQNLGDQSGLTYCGPRIIQVLSNTTVFKNFMSIDPVSRLITVMSMDDSDVGVYDIDLLVYLQDYKTVNQTATFQVEVIFCQVSKLDFDPVPDQVYTVYTPQIQFTATPFRKTPGCFYPLEYTFELKDKKTGQYSALPPWIVNKGGLDFSVQTDDPSHVGDYIICVRGSTPTQFMDPPLKADLEILLTVNNDCENDEVLRTSTIASETYTIAMDGTHFFNPTWTSSVPGCPISHKIGRVVNGVQRPLTPTELRVISFSNSDGKMKYATDDFTLDTQVWTIKIYRSSTFSSSAQREGAYLFDLTFLDRCWEADLRPPLFDRTAFEFDLWQDQLIVFKEMVDQTFSPDFCGGFTSQLEYFSGPLYDPSHPMGANLTHYSRFAMPNPAYGAFKGVVGSREWLGLHQFRLRGTLGTFDPSPTARGRNGFYATVFSAPVNVTIVDPCRNSTVNLDRQFKVAHLRVPVNETRVTFEYNGPTNSISKIYGNGYDKCGPLSYSFTDWLGEPFELDSLRSSTVLGNGFADNITFALDSPKMGSELTANFTLKVQLLNYPTAVPFSQLVNVTYRECFPDDFSGPRISLEPMRVGEEGFETSTLFNQFPCNYEQEYFIEVVDRKSGTSIVVPGFIDFRGEVIIFNEPDSFDIGDYAIKVCSKLHNSFKTVSCSAFNIQVLPVATNTTYSQMPDFLLSLKDQRVKVRSSLIYEVGLPLNNYGYAMTLDVWLGDAFRFAEFDYQLNLFKVNGGLTNLNDIGEYPIQVSARYFNGLFEQTYRKSFTLTVWDDPPPLIAPWFPPEPIFYSQWDQPILRANSTQEFDPERPIPFIKALREDGMLEIGWDRSMLVPNYTLIEPSKVAVEKDFNQSEVRFWEQRRVRGLREYDDFVILEAEPDIHYFADNQTRFYEQMKLLDALELLITPDDLEAGIKLNFTWHMVRFTPNSIFIQLTFENYWQIAGDSALDTLSVTFWGVQFFRSWQNKDVLYGTTLYWPLVRQIAQEDMEFIRWFADALLVLVLVCFAFAAPVVNAGSLLPTWVFVNSLQIISHMVLLKSIMPAPAQFFLKKWNDWVRWYDPDFIVSLQRQFDWKRYDIDFGNYHIFFLTADYTHLIAQNMVVIVLLLLVCLLVWTLLATKDWLVKLLPRPARANWWGQMHSPWWQNFVLRFCYEFFLEFCICATLQLTVVDFTDFSPTLQFFLALSIFVALLASIAFVVSLFFKGGPWVPAFYATNTVMQSTLLDYRTRNPDFDGKKWLSNNPAAPMKPWGTAIITFDFNKALNVLTCGKAQRRENPSYVTKLDFAKLYDEPPLAKAGEVVNPNQKENEKKVSRDAKSADGPVDGRATCQDKQDWVEPESKYNPIELLEGGAQVRAHNESYRKYRQNLEKQLLGQKKSTDCRGSFEVEIDEQLALKSWARKEAHLRVKVSDRVQPPPQYKTLFNGLRLNSERNVAIVEPLLFLLRRLIYALVIVFLDQVMYIGVFVVLLCTLFTLCFALAELQWKERIINLQHVFDEVAIYICCVFLLLFGNYVDDVTRWSLAYALIAVCSLYIVFNSVVVAIYSLRLWWRFLKRIFLQRRRHRLQMSALFIIEQLNQARLGLCPKQKKKPDKQPEAIAKTDEQDSGAWFNPDDLEFVPVDTRSGGYGAVQVKSRLVFQEMVDAAISEHHRGEQLCDPEAASLKDERLDHLYGKWWERSDSFEIQPPPLLDHEMLLSQKNFGNKVLVLERDTPLSEIIETRKSKQVPTVEESSAGYDGNSAQRLLLENEPVDLAQIEKEQREVDLAVEEEKLYLLRTRGIFGHRQMVVAKPDSSHGLAHQEIKQQGVEHRRECSCNCGNHNCAPEESTPGPARLAHRSTELELIGADQGLHTQGYQFANLQIHHFGLREERQGQHSVVAPSDEQSQMVEHREGLPQQAQPLKKKLKADKTQIWANETERNEPLAERDSQKTEKMGWQHRKPPLIQVNPLEEILCFRNDREGQKEMKDFLEVSLDGARSQAITDKSPAKPERRTTCQELQKLGSSTVNPFVSRNINQFPAESQPIDPYSIFNINVEALKKNSTQRTTSIGRNKRRSLFTSQKSNLENQIQYLEALQPTKTNMMQSFKNQQEVLNQGNEYRRGGRLAASGDEFDLILQNYARGESRNHKMYNFHKSRGSSTSQSSLLSLTDAVPVRPAGDTRDCISVTQKDAIRSQRKQKHFSAAPYGNLGRTTQFEVNERDPEFIGLSGVKNDFNGAVQGLSERESPRSLKRDPNGSISISMRNSVVDYDAPLTSTGLNILDSVPKLDNLTIKEPFENVRSVAHTVERKLKRPRYTYELSHQLP